MLSAILGDFLPYILAALGAVAGVLGYGWKKKREGASQERTRNRVKDLEGAAKVREKLDALDDDNDVSPVERLRAAGRLRDGD